jgi:hypothetical protein
MVLGSCRDCDCELSNTNRVARQSCRHNRASMSVNRRPCTTADMSLTAGNLSIAAYLGKRKPSSRSSSDVSITRTHRGMSTLLLEMSMLLPSSNYSPWRCFRSFVSLSLRTALTDHHDDDLHHSESALPSPTNYAQG